MEALYVATQQRLFELEHQHGYEVHSKWECDFHRELKQNPELRGHYNGIFIPGHLDPRVHSLRGGRTEPFAFSHRCHLDDEEIFLLDIVSLLILRLTFLCEISLFYFVLLGQSLSIHYEICRVSSTLSRGFRSRDIRRSTGMDQTRRQQIQRSYILPSQGSTKSAATITFISYK